MEVPQTLGGVRGESMCILRICNITRVCRDLGFAAAQIDQLLIENFRIAAFPRNMPTSR
jgi:hypothetical protein|tara:strand:+ start:778 stop:954 length:177 start_codon:yes stop_codon:yes gene_type:complete